MSERLLLESLKLLHTLFEYKANEPDKDYEVSGPVCRRVAYEDAARRTKALIDAAEKSYAT